MCRGGALRERVLDSLAVLLILAGLLGRFGAVARYAFWGDEWESVIVARGLAAASIPEGALLSSSEWPTWSVSGVLASTVRYQTPPAYPLLLGSWTAGAGTGRVGCRSLSLLLDLACMAGIWTVSGWVFGRRSALFATAFWAISPLAMELAIEARAYALGGLAALLSTVCFWTALESGRLSRWMIYGVLVAALGYIHYFALAVPAAHVAFVAVTRRRVLRGHLLGICFAVAAYSPWAAIGLPAQWAGVSRVYVDLSRQSMPGYSDTATIASVSRSLAYGLSSLFGLDPSAVGLRARYVILPACGALGFLLLAGLRRWGLRSPVGLACLTALVPPVLLSAYALLFAGVVIPLSSRHMYFGLPALAIVFGAGQGAGAAPHRWLGTVLLFGGAVSSLGLQVQHPIKVRTSAFEWAVDEAKAAPRALIVVGGDFGARIVAASRKSENGVLVLSDAVLAGKGGETGPQTCPLRGFVSGVVLMNLAASSAIGRACPEYTAQRSMDDGQTKASVWCHRSTEACP